MTIEVDCYNCESKNRSWYAAENGFNLVKCSDCGLLYVTPRPSDDDIAKAHQYGMHEGEKTLETTGKYSTLRSKAYDEILNELYATDLLERKRSWLDIGCGQGEFLTALIRYSNGKINVKGLEPNQYKRESAQQRGLDVDFYDLESSTEKFDCISFLNVFSHLPEPMAFFKTVKKLLNPKAEILLQTGDVAHLSASELYRPMLLPDHLCFASEKILLNMLNRSGFESIKIVKKQVVTVTPGHVVKELVKLIHPGKKSMLKFMASEKYKTDMYIRAKLSV